MSSVVWTESQQTRVVALNVAARYAAIIVEIALGFLMLPFNTRHLGADDYGLWMLAASIVAYFPVLDLGYGGAMERFVADYRARRDARAINEIASTLFVAFAALGLIALGVVSVLALNVETLFNLSAGQGGAGRIAVLFLGVHFALALPFSVFGAIVNGFQRTYLNGLVGIAVALAAAVTNVLVLVLGGGLVALVAALTATRMLGLLWYRLNAYRVFPLLRLRPSFVRRARLHEVTEFSVYVFVQNMANKVNYATDPIVIAAVISTGAVAVWTVSQRLADMVQRLTSQLNAVLFPVVVDCDSAQRHERLRDLLVQGTRISLVTAVPVVGALMLLAEPVVVGWTGPGFQAAALLLQLLAAVVLVQVGTATAGTVLRGAGHHRLLAVSNVIAAAVNVGLSLMLIRTHGLPGVAVATLLPVTIRGVAVVLPVACARVGIPVRRFVAEALWPALWPAFPAFGLLALVRNSVGPSLGQCVLYGGAAGALYLLIFVGVAIGRADRARYVARLRGMTFRPPELEAA
jgi:O-antigen/teichoic acid export membrane protein